MNYSEARQRASDGRWDWTTMNDGRVWKSEPCSSHEDSHATKEEAERHHYDWEMDNARPMTLAQMQHPCAVCQAWTDGGLQLPDGYEAHILCPEHRTRAGLEQVRPFSPGLLVIHS